MDQEENGSYETKYFKKFAETTLVVVPTSSSEK